MIDDSTSTMVTSRSRAAGGVSSDGSPPAAPISVVLAHHDEIVLNGLRATLAPFAERLRVVEPDGDSIGRADLVLADLLGGRRDSLELAAKLIADDRADRVVLLTWGAPAETLAAADEIDLDGVVLASSSGPELVAALERVAAGERVGIGDADGEPTEELSSREREVLALLAHGHSNREIAEALFLSIDTVKTYVRRVFAKLGVNNRTQAALRAAGYGLAPSRPRMAGPGGPASGE